MGAGVTGLLGLMLRARFPNIRGWAFAPPAGLMSPQVRGGDAEAVNVCVCVCMCRGGLIERGLASRTAHMWRVCRVEDLAQRYSTLLCLHACTMLRLLCEESPMRLS